MISAKKGLFHYTAILLLLAAISTARISGISAAEPFRTSALISDNMVIQQHMKVPLWGWANPGEKITVVLGKKKVSATTDPTGRWQLKIGPFKPGGPYEMRINGESADSSKTISNILVGDVWIASGQSNMQMRVGPAGAPMSVTNAAEEIASANYPDIRMFTVAIQVASKPVNDVRGAWSVCSPETVASFSATGYFFARDLQQEIKIPIGIITNPVGGRAVECFMSRPTLEETPGGKEALERGDKKAHDFPAAFEAYMQQVESWEQGLDKAEAEGRAVGDIPPPVMDKNLPAMLHGASRIYNGMVAPVIPYGARGFIWYQGETNAMHPEYHDLWFPGMIREWRTEWGLGDLPFLFVQLPNFGKAGGNVPDSWAIIREDQLHTLALPKTAMATIIDSGETDNIHPHNKQVVGHRLALAALAKVYGEKIAYSGPIYDSMKVKDSKIRLKFRHAEGGLRARNVGNDYTTDAPLNTFTIAGADQQFVPAQAKIEGNTVVVWSDAVKNPAAVRYAWSNNPLGCNLYNKAALPASPFRTDSWPITAQGK